MIVFPEIDLDDPPPFLMVGGTEPYLRTKYLLHLRSGLSSSFDVEDVWCDDGTSSYAVLSVLERVADPFSDTGRRAVFVWDVQRVKDRNEQLLAYLNEPYEHVFAVFVVSLGSTAGGFFLSSLRQRYTYEPTPLIVNHERDQVAPWIRVRFAVHGLNVDELTCRSLHRLVGHDDLFTLDSEVRKVVSHCRAEGIQQPNETTFRDVIVRRVFPSVFDLKDKILASDLTGSMSVVHEMFESSESVGEVATSVSTTMLDAFQSWLRIVSTHRSGVPLDEITSIPSWVLKNKIWPQLKKWRARPLVVLQSEAVRLECLAKTGRADRTAVELFVLRACGALPARNDNPYV